MKPIPEFEASPTGIMLVERREGFLWMSPCAYINIPAERWTEGIRDALDKAYQYIRSWKGLRPKGRIAQVRMHFGDSTGSEILKEIASYFRGHSGFAEELGADRAEWHFIDGLKGAVQMVPRSPLSTQDILTLLNKASQDMNAGSAEPHA